VIWPDHERYDEALGMDNCLHDARSASAADGTDVGRAGAWVTSEPGRHRLSRDPHWPQFAFRLKQLGRRGWANPMVVPKLEGSSPLGHPTPHPDAVPRSCPAPPSRVRAAGGKSLRLRTQHAGDDAIVC
jgi:hypothetical protein